MSQTVRLHVVSVPPVAHLDGRLLEFEAWQRKEIERLLTPEAAARLLQAEQEHTERILNGES